MRWFKRAPGIERAKCGHRLGWCYRCGLCWDCVDHHTTTYRFDGEGWFSRGMFPLCEGCWKALTPAERVPFYLRLLQHWIEDYARLNLDFEGGNGATTEEITRAVWWEALQGGEITMPEYVAALTEGGQP